MLRRNIKWYVISPGKASYRCYWQDDPLTVLRNQVLHGDTGELQAVVDIYVDVDVSIVFFIMPETRPWLLKVNLCLPFTRYLLTGSKIPAPAM